MNTPRLSIIVPVYNVEKYLRRCLDSILAQTFTDFELLLIDDGSKDDSGKICDEYAEKDSRVTVFHKENGGVSTARNLGIDNAHGEYITFIDSDDWIEPSYGQVLIDNIGDADIMFFDEIWHYEDGCTNIMSSGSFYSKDRKEIEEKVFQMIDGDSRHNYFGYTWNKIFRHSVISSSKIKFIEGLSVSEDEVFTLDFILKAKCLKVLSPAPLYNYRWQQQGLTHAKSKAMLLLAQTFNDRKQYLSNEKLISQYEKRILSYLITEMLNSNVFSRRKKALSLLLKYGKEFRKSKFTIGLFVKMFIKNSYEKISKK